MTTISKRMCVLLLACSTMAVSGCGSSGSSAVDTTALQKGAVVQGPVVGATVFADNVVGGTRFVKDTGEITAPLTGTGGSYFLPSFPSYDFILVSSGGTDTITSQPALLLLAPSGSAHITPLTTLVALDTTKKVQAKLEAMMGNASFDTNVSTNSSEAILLLIKSTEAAVQSIRDAVQLAAGAAGVTLTTTQINYIQSQAWQQIALTFAGTTQNLATPAGLDAALTTAITGAIANINGANTNITISSTSAAAIAHGSVNAALSALGSAATYTSATALATSGVRAEGSLANVAGAYQGALTANKTSLSVVIIGDTPNAYAPPPIQVVSTTSATIILIKTGASGGTGSVGIGIIW